MGFEELKRRQSVIWGAGPFEEVEYTITEMYESILDALEPVAGKSWLDVGCGTGGLSMSAARAGADVTGVDLAPALIYTAKERAAKKQLEIRYEEGDCENLQFEDGSFDIVSSSVGVMFAPDHAAAAAELARVCAPGGRLGLSAWRPEGGVGRFFRFMLPYQPPLPDGVGIPLLWGTEDHVTSLLGEYFELSFEELDCPYEAESSEAAWELFSRAFGPTRTLAQSMSDEDRASFREAFIEFSDQDRVEGGGIRQSRTYLLATGTRR